MSNSTDKTAIANISYLACGQNLIDNLTDNTPQANRLRSIFENVVKELLGRDWVFSRKNIKFEDLTQVYKLTLDASPTLAAFVVGKTITGVTSGVTCTVLERLSDTIYLVTKPSGTFTDGEVLGDGTSTRDCTTGYPETTTDLAQGTYNYGYVMPTDCLYIRGVGDENCDKEISPHTKKGRIIYTNANEDSFFNYNKWIGEDESATTSDVTNMPVWFHRLISARLAYLTAQNTTQNQYIQLKTKQELSEAWLDALEQNGEEVSHDAEQEINLWTDASQILRSY